MSAIPLRFKAQATKMCPLWVAKGFFGGLCKPSLEGWHVGDVPWKWLVG